jgi:hypothetical protein
MAQLINFDEQCRNKNALLYAEIIHRRACARMYKKECEHQIKIDAIRSKHKRFTKIMNKLNFGLLIFAVIGIIYSIITFK